MKQALCALVFVLAGLVSGIPHGYGGVKSGAVAKAEAGAVAGSFGGFPIPVPTGGAYSGSFSSSKSSAANFASSSAHSSSFSFSGAGGHPEVNNGGSPSGCASGNCPIANDLSSGLAGSDAAALAGAAATSAQLNPDGSPCKGNCANQKPAQCSGPNCGSTQCTSGQCDGVPSPNKHDSNDIQVNGGAKNDYGSSGSPAYNPPQYGSSNPGCTSGNCVAPTQYNPNKVPAYAPSSPDCTSGNCGSSGEKPFKTLSNSPTSSGCASGNCGSPTQYKPNIVPAYGPSSHGCTSGNCGSPNQKPDKTPSYGPTSPGCTSGNCGSPTQYNPNTVTAYGPSTLGCTSGNCGSPSQNPNKTPSYGPTSPGCTSGNCGSLNQYNLKPTNDDSEDDGSYKPEYNPNDYSDDNDNGQYQPTKCDSGNCNGDTYQYHQAGAGSAASAGASLVVTKPTTSLTAPIRVPTQGCTSPNCGSNSVKHPKPSSYNVPLYPGRSPPGDNSGCASGDCYGNLDNSPPTNSYSVSNHLTPAYIQPTSAPQPSYTQPKCSTPGCNSQTQTTEAFPSFVPLKEHIGSPNCETGKCGGFPAQPSGASGAVSYPVPAHPIPAPGHQAPVASAESTGCGTSNCGGQPSLTAPIAKPSGYDVPKPVPAPAPNNCGPGGCSRYPTNPSYGPSPAKQPVYTGGFGAPSGILKPNDFSAPKPLVIPQQQQAPKPHYPTLTSQHIVPAPQGNILSTPTSAYKPTSQPQYGHDAGAGAGAFAAASANAVAYTGGFGGPPGLLKPYDGGRIGSGPVAVGPKYQPTLQNSPVSGSYGASLNGATPGSETPHINAPSNSAYNPGSGSYGGSSAGAAAAAQAGAISGAYSGGFGFGTNDSSGAKNGSGCNSGCNGSSDNHDDKRSSRDGSGLAGSFASSSASAHASSGAFTKGYGRR